VNSPIFDGLIIVRYKFGKSGGSSEKVVFENFFLEWVGMVGYYGVDLMEVISKQ
jgi:hypothetical protein